MAHFEIKQAQPDDARLLFRLLQLYFFEQSRWSGEDIGPDGWYDACEQGIADYTQGGEDRAYLLWCDNQLAGCVLTEPAPAYGVDCRELADVFVLPKYRGHGLCQYLITELVNKTIHPWLLAVFRQDEQAHQYWQRRFAQGLFRSVEALPQNPRFYLYLLNTTPVGVGKQSM